MILALLSELTGLSISPSVVSTGTIGLKLDVGPVGGLGGYGTQTGKIIGILKSQKVHVTDLVLPVANFQAAADEMRILDDEGVHVHPVSEVSECLNIVFRLEKDELVAKIRERLEMVGEVTKQT
jgi:predicted ATP-dependent protease